MFPRIHSPRARRSVARGLALAIALLAVAAPASAAKVTDVRVGLHKTFTRVVFETDTPARYRLERTPSGEIEILLDAMATSRRVSTRSELLREVRVTPGREATRATLRLRGQDVKVNELILLDPPRIVLDLRGTGESIVAATPEPPAPAPTATPDEPAPSAAETARLALEKERQRQVALAEQKKEAAQARAAAERTAAEQARTAAEKARAAAEQQAAEKAAAQLAAASEKARKDREARATEAAAEQLAAGEQAAAEQARAAATGTAEKAAEALATKSGEMAGAATEPDEPVARAGEAAAGAIAPQAGGGAPTPEPGAGTRIARNVPAPTARPERTPAAKPGAAREPAPAPAADSAIPSFLRDPVVLGGLGLAIALAIGILVHQRRSGREDDYLSPMGDDDEPFSIDEGVASETETHAAPGSGADETSTPEEGMDEDFQASQSPAHEDEEAAVVNTGTDSSIETGYSPVPPTGGANADLMSMFQELERRVTMLEKKLEETTEAKERLERQVAAQTEELRVQRSAIARTQRALRAVARPEDEATEPVPKS